MDSVGDSFFKRLEALSRGEEHLASSLDLDQRAIDALVERAKALFATGRVEEGDRLLSNVVRVDNQSAALPFLLGALRAEAHDHMGATLAYDEAVRRADTFGNPTVAQKARFCRAQSLLAQGAVSSAIEDLRMAEAGQDTQVAEAAAAWKAQLARGARV